jgi:hypothetical protein
MNSSAGLALASTSNLRGPSSFTCSVLLGPFSKGCIVKDPARSGINRSRWEGPLGKFTYLADLRGTNYGLKQGDILKASIVGNVITVSINGLEKA